VTIISASVLKPKFKADI